MAELLFLQPVFKEMVWGGECWGISVCQNGDCKVSRGIYEGESLSGLWNHHPELFGNDAERLGKTEFWYVQDCEPGASIEIQQSSDKSHSQKLETEAVDKEHLEICTYYTVEKYDVHGTWNHKFLAPFVNVSVLDGEGTINGIEIKKGMHFMIPSGYGICEMKGQFTLICSWVPDTAPESDNVQNSIDIKVYDWMGRLKAEEADESQVVMAFEDIYEEGDTIKLTIPRIDTHYIIRIDDAMDKSLVYMTKKSMVFEIPFGERKKSYNPKSFTGRRHYLTCRPARDYEICSYRNLAKNVMDQHEACGCFPHVSANVETRGESVFAARNAIDGVIANCSHGSWPYESWGINKREDAEMLLEFGRPVEFDRIVIWTRADFPHDNWWTQAQLLFSDGTQETVKMEKSQKPHEFYIEKRNITWIKLRHLVQSSDPSPFPALTQIKVYGSETAPVLKGLRV